MLGPMSTERDRVISISLTEEEWQAFVARQPQPVVWLRERIRDEVHHRPHPGAGLPEAVTAVSEELSTRTVSVPRGC
jgi:hypothetical protein